MIDFNDVPLQKQITKPTPIIPDLNPIESFRQAMAQYGLSATDIICDGEIHRFGKKLNSYYSIHTGKLHFGMFGSWEKDNGHGIRWCSGRESEMSQKDLADHERILEGNRIKLKAIKKEKHSKAKAKVKKLWNDSPDATTHPYLDSKGVSSYGLKMDGNTLLIPMKDENGKLCSLQRINENKKFYPGGKVIGCSHTIHGNGTIYLTEGYATGATLHAATGATTIIAFNSGNLKVIAQQITKPFTICADNDQWKHEVGNVGVTAANEAARLAKVECKVIIPQFKDITGFPTDFNDLALLEGLSVVKDQLKGDKFPPLSIKQTRLSTILKKCPPSREFILDYSENGFLPRGIVGNIAATGGTGKSFFLAQLAVVLAGKGSLGGLNAKRKFSTLFIAGEDDQDEIHRRFWNITRGSFPSKLHAVSTVGEVGPLMKLDGNNPVKSGGYYWLDETISLHKGLEVLIIDPKSRFYGLNENDNDHSTQWIACLEELSKRYNLTILFAQHTSKTTSEDITQNMGRGGSATTDGCRWQAGMIRLGEKKANAFGIDNPRLYVEFNAPKNNYCPDMPDSLFFKRNQYGVLEPVDLMGEQFISISKVVREMIRNDIKEYSIRDIEKGGYGKEFRDELMEKFPGFQAKMTQKMIDYMIKKDMVILVKQDGGDIKAGKPKFIIRAS